MIAALIFSGRSYVRFREFAGDRVMTQLIINEPKKREEFDEDTRFAYARLYLMLCTLSFFRMLGIDLFKKNARH